LPHTTKLSEENFMHRLRHSRILTSSAAVLIALLCVAGSTLFSGATAYAAAKKSALPAIYGAMPLWKYAQRISLSGLTPHSGGGGGGGGGNGIPECVNSAVPPRCFSPAQIRRAYGIQSVIDNGFTGKGETIVIVDGSSSPTLQADVHLYDLLYGLPDPKINVILPTGFYAYDPGWYQETALDVEISHALAPDATIDLVVPDLTTVQTPADEISLLLGAVKYAVDNDLGDVISQSYGVGESCVGSAYLPLEQAVFAKAKAKGITVLASAGDSGVLTLACSGGGIFEGKGVSVPSSDPLVTAVGGTSLDATVGKGKYVSETTWNEWNAGGGATGGGFSSIFAAPSYQQGVPGISSARGVPDVAFDADPFTGVPIVLSEQGATLIVPIGGTSVGSPAWAGIVALADQYAGHRLGFLNPALYQILAGSSYSKAFHDITTGDNSVSLFDQNGNPVPVPGYSAGPGWDAVTGVGTPIVSGLVKALANSGGDDD
jgi:subtilase family serine protease